MHGVRFLLLLALGACAATPPLVTSSGVVPSASYSVAGDTPAADEVRRQLTARGRHAATAPATIRVGFAASPRQLGICTGSSSTGSASCPAWLDAPQSGFAPFVPRQRYRLTLALDGGSVSVVQPAGKTAPLPAMVTAALAVLVPAATD